MQRSFSDGHDVLAQEVLNSTPMYFGLFLEFSDFPKPNISNIVEI